MNTIPFTIFTDAQTQSMAFFNKTHMSRENKLLIGSFILSLLVLFYKRPDAFYYSQFWAEEGVVFFSEAYHQGFGSLFNTCAGYFHLFPRLMACIAVSLSLPLHLVPFLFCYSWLLVFFSLLYYIWKRLPYSDVKRFFIATTVALIPLQSEIIMNLTNLQWMMVLFPIIIFSSDSVEKNKKWFFADLLIVLLSGFTGPNYTVLLPLFLFLIILQGRQLKNDSRRLILYLLFVAIGTLGVIALSGHGNIDRTHGEFTLLNAGFIHYLFVQYWFLLLGKFALQPHIILMTIGVVIVLVYMLTLLVKIHKNNSHLFPLIAFYTGLLFLATTLIAYRNEPSLLDPYYRGVRNFYIPALTFVWVFISVSKENRALRIALSVFILGLIMQTILFVKPFCFEDNHLMKYTDKIHEQDTLSIPVNPEGWYIRIDKGKINR